MRYSLIVFDWDGTLMDSAALIAQCVQQAAIDLGLAPPSLERARYIIGLGLADALAQALPDLPPERRAEMAERYRVHYLMRDSAVRLFAGAAELLSDLAQRGHLLAIATGKSRTGLTRALATSGLADLFYASRTSDECYGKPHPQMLEELMIECGASPEATLMIGDTSHDLQMAANAGVASVAVSHGAHPRAALLAANPLYCAADLAELHTWLRAQG